MAKEKVFIVVTHKHSLKKGTKDQWETAEQVEFVNQLRNRHTSMSTAVADYINKKMLSGTRYGITDYEAFIEYIRKKYPKQMAELDAMYGQNQAVEEKVETPVFVDQFGNVRAKTVFDV
jgi:hypothetical protein